MDSARSATVPALAGCMVSGSTSLTTTWPARTTVTSEQTRPRRRPAGDDHAGRPACCRAGWRRPLAEEGLGDQPLGRSQAATSSPVARSSRRRYSSAGLGAQTTWVGRPSAGWPASDAPGAVSVGAGVVEPRGGQGHGDGGGALGQGDGAADLDVLDGVAVDAQQVAGHGTEAHGDLVAGGGQPAVQGRGGAPGDELGHVELALLVAHRPGQQGQRGALGVAGLAAAGDQRQVDAAGQRGRVDQRPALELHRRDRCGPGRRARGRPAAVAGLRSQADAPRPAGGAGRDHHRLAVAGSGPGAQVDRAAVGEQGVVAARGGDRDRGASRRGRRRGAPSSRRPTAPDRPGSRRRRCCPPTSGTGRPGSRPRPGAGRWPVQRPCRSAGGPPARRWPGR